jgi:hypothetical protein
MPEDDPDVFSLFLEWLYLGHLQPVIIDKHTKTSGPIFDRIKLYCFAEKHCLVDLMNYTMSSLMSTYAKHNRLPICEAMAYAYRNTAAGLRVRPFIAHALRHIICNLSGGSHWSSEDITQHMLEVEDLTMDVLPLMRSDRQSERSPGGPASLSKCTFHVHKQGGVCSYKETVL